MGKTFLITRCPGCGTAFRASEIQLSLRAGEVRCGRCETVFDGRAHALPGEHVTAAGEPEAPPPATEEMPVSSGEPASDDAAASDPAGPEPLILTPPPSEALPHEIEVELQPVIQSDVADPNLEFDFGRPRQGSSFGHRLLSLSAVGLLTVALGLQVTFHFRGDIALLFPDAKPVLEAFCARAGCNLPLPQRAEMMSIEYSDLQADTLNPAVMVLSATLRNRAPFAQTPPALELTLTDAQDQPLARRVLTVADYYPRATSGASVSSPAEADPTFPSGSELPVKVYFDASAVQPTGYRLYLFYP